MGEPTPPDDTEGLREQIQAILDEFVCGCEGHHYDACSTCMAARIEQALVSPVLERQQAEIERLTEERDLAVAHDRQPYPTAWAHEQALKALETQRQRAEKAEAELAEEAAQLEALRRLANHGAERARHVRMQRDALQAAIDRARRRAQVWIDIRPTFPSPEGGALAHAGEQVLAALDTHQPPVDAEEASDAGRD